MSKPRDDRRKGSIRLTLDQINNLRHLLVRLSWKNDWEFLEGRFSAV